MIVEGIKHDINADASSHVVTLQLTETTNVNPAVWKLGVSKLGIDTVLGGNGTAFNPGSLPNCTLYLRSDVGVATSGANVTIWGDQSGNGRDATTKTGLGFAAPTLVPLVQAAKPAVRFNALTVPIQMTFPSSPFGANWTAFLVLTAASGGFPSPALVEFASSYNRQIFITYLQKVLAEDSDTTHDVTVADAGTAALNTPYIITGTSAQGQPVTVYTNGDAGTAASAASPLAIVTPTFSGLLDGVGDLYAVIIYNRVLNATERAYVINGLNTLYAVY
jgi:hypothetical protein